MTLPVLTPLETAIVARVAQAAEARPEAEAVWVFGSRARAASDEWSDLDIAVQFGCAETPALRLWLEQVRQAAVEAIADQWPGFLDLVGLYAAEADGRLAARVRAEGTALWRRAAPVVASPAGG